MSFQNDGNEGYKILEGVTPGILVLDGTIMPNIKMISPDAIVPDGTTITFNYTTSPTPTGGANGDIWYNLLTDVLYKKIAGLWQILTNRVVNQWYVAPVINLTDCPLPAPPDDVYLTSFVDYGDTNNFEPTFYIKDVDGNSVALTIDLVINYGINYTQGGVPTSTAPLTVTLPAGTYSKDFPSQGSYDPALGAPVSLSTTITSVTPNPNGGSTVHFT